MGCTRISSPVVFLLHAILNSIADVNTLATITRHEKNEVVNGMTISSQVVRVTCCESNSSQYLSTAQTVPDNFGMVSPHIARPKEIHTVPPRLP